jgi:chloramphenicol 3-O-phosphotransferase
MPMRGLGREPNGQCAVSPNRHSMAAMNLIFLHGAPASGKLTVAKALLAAMPARLLDNHAAIDAARTIFDFGAPGFWELVDTVRGSILRAAIENDISCLIVTLCYSELEDRPFFDQLEDDVVRNGGSVFPVFLHCSEREAAQRVGNADRVQRRKTSSVKGRSEFLSRYTIAPVPRENCLAIDTEITAPDRAAEQIMQHFALR